VLAYPAKSDAFDPLQLGDALRDVGLSHLTGRLAEETSWPHFLSLGEQQRVSLARTLLMKPDILFLDESTSAIDEEGEAALYRLIAERLPKTAIVSIGHRSTLQAFHKEQLNAKRQADGAFKLATVPGKA
jgi:vitamin B12/bleomycin/antimicrobial peptide transport system ATP-binding/permease protein